MTLDRWPTRRLAEVTSKVGSGATPRGGAKSYKDEGMSLIRSLNVYDLHFDSTGLALIDETQADKLSNAEVRSGDVLLNITGASVARCSLVPDRVLPARVNQHVAIVRPEPKALESRFLAYTLAGPLNKARLLAIAQGGATREALTKQKIEDFEILVPPLATQRKIAAVLAAYDELIESNFRRIEILEEMAQAIYREWFVDFRYPDHEGDCLVDSPLGPIPETWTVQTIEEIGGGASGVIGGPFGSKLGRKDYVASGVPVIRGGNLNGVLGFNYDGLAFVSEKKYVDLRTSSAKPGDIIVTQRGTLGQVGLIPESSHFDRYVVSQSQMRLTVDPRQSAHLFVYQTLRWSSVNRRLVDHAMAAGVPHINLGILRAFKIIVAPPELALRFDHLVRPGRRLMENLARQNANLRVTRDLLLRKLVSGQIDVSDIDIDTSWLAA